MKLSRRLSQQIFTITTERELLAWIGEVDKEIGGTRWVPLGGIANNVHSVEVASDPGLALVEGPTNCIDALLDLRAREYGATASSPHEAAQKWWGVPVEGLTGMENEERRELADRIRVTMIEAKEMEQPTIVLQDQGTGQHPDDFSDTHVSLLASNKKGASHQMGVYNAGGSARYKFAKATIIASRLAPTLLNGRPDEIGVTVVRYDPLDPDKYKSGMYVYLVDNNKEVMRLDIDELPDLSYGSHIRLIEYEIPKYARGAHEPKSSLWHLFHAALPDPALPLRIIETRANRFPGMKGKVERRVVAGLLHLLRRQGTADYQDERTIDLGPDVGRIVLRYFVLNEGTDPEAYTRADQALTITNNGQRQITRDRQWLKRNTELYFLYKRLLVVVDGTGLTNAAKRHVFASTRESGVDSPLTKTILDRVALELTEDENLDNLDELAKQRTLAAATKTATDKVKKQLASQIASFLKGELPGGKGGRRTRRRRRKRRRRSTNPTPPKTDDSLMLEQPNKLAILTRPLRIEQGATAPLRLEINAKNGFLPKYGACLSVVFGPEVKDHVRAVAKGRLLGGHVRVTIEAGDEAPVGASAMTVALVVQELGVALMAEGPVEILARREDDKEEDKTGGEPNIDARWVGRDQWPKFEPAWDEETVGVCNIYRDDPNDKKAITKVEFVLNEAFAPYEQVVQSKKLTEATAKAFREGYEFPVLFGLFRQRLAEDAKEEEADEAGQHIEVPDEYVKGEKARMARAVLMAMEPDIRLVEATES